ncbi:hypothetical protein BGZ88_004798 [Linnemannia elongata]|nr:hypothetical protein BGZ88_004798 [Linnemannia elongata]
MLIVSAVTNIVNRWSAFIPGVHTKQEADHDDILDISQNGQLDSLGSLKDRITEGVFKSSPGKRQIPIVVMYQGDGANLYAAYSSIPAYYLYLAERSILQTYANEMASLIADRSSIIELGAGSLEKTQVLLQAVAQAPQIVDGIDYYALDINRQALVESLASLPALKTVKCHGLYGTYNDGLNLVAKLQRRSDIEQVLRVFMWLGSSIGNLTIEGAIGMVKSIADVMVDGDMILIGLDGWNSEMTIDAAYEPADKLVLNTLMNANEILGQAVFDMSKFVYSTQVNRLEGRNECCCMVSEDIELKYEGETVRIKRGERILVVPSYKYTDEQVIEMVKATGCLEVVRRFGRPDDGGIHYGIWMWRKTARATFSP